MKAGGGGAGRPAKVKVVDRQTLLWQIAAKQAEIAAAKDEVKNEQRINTALLVGLTQRPYQWNYEPQRAPVTLLN